MTSPPPKPTASEPDSTSTGLLALVQANDAEAWRRLVHLYGPLVYRWCRRCDLQEEDAADVSQEVFRAVAASVAGFRREEGGTFRGWLWTVTRNKTRDHLRRRAKEPSAVGGSAVQRRLLEVPDLSEEETFSQTADDRHRLVHATLQMIRPDFESSSWTAFWRATMEGESAATIAASCRLRLRRVARLPCEAASGKNRPRYAPALFLIENEPRIPRPEPLIRHGLSFQRTAFRVRARHARRTRGCFPQRAYRGMSRLHIDHRAVGDALRLADCGDPPAAGRG